MQPVLQDQEGKTRRQYVGGYPRNNNVAVQHEGGKRKDPCEHCTRKNRRQKRKPRVTGGRTDRKGRERSQKHAPVQGDIRRASPLSKHAANRSDQNRRKATQNQRKKVTGRVHRLHFSPKRRLVINRIRIPCKMKTRAKGTSLVDCITVAPSIKGE